MPRFTANRPSGSGRRARARSAVCACALVVLTASAASRAGAQGAASGESWISRAEPCLDLRPRAETAAPSLDCLVAGTRMALLERAGAWGRMRLEDGREGWVELRLVEAAATGAGDEPLSATLSDLERQLIDLQLDLEARRAAARLASRRRLEAEAELRGRLQTTEVALAAARATIASAERETRELEASLAERTVEGETAQAEVERLTSRAVALEVEVESLRPVAERVPGLEEQLDLARATIASEKRETRELEASLAERTVEGETAQAEVERLTSRAVALEVEMESLRPVAERVPGLEERLGSARATIASAERETRELEASLAERTVEGETAQAEVERLSSRLAALESEVGTLRPRAQRVADLEQRLRAAEDLLAGSERAKGGLEARLAETERERDERGRLLEARKAENSDLESALSAARADAELLPLVTTRAEQAESDLVDARSLGGRLGDELAERTSERDRLVEARVTLDATIAGLESEVMSLRAAADRAPELEEQLATARRELAASEAARDDLAVTLQATEAESEALGERAAALEVEERRLQSALQSARGLADLVPPLTERAERAEAELAELRAASADRDERNRRLAASLEEGASERLALQAAKEDLEARLTSMAAELASLRTANERLPQLAEQLAAAERRGDELEAAARTRATAQGAWLATREDLERRLAESERSRQSLSARVEDLQAQNQSLVEFIELIRQDLDGEASSEVGSRPPAPTGDAVAPPAAEARAPQPVVVPEPASERSGVETAQAGPGFGELVEAWASAWSDRRVDDYLAFYAADFEPAGGLGRSAWEEQRRRRISAPDRIDVKLALLDVRVGSPGTAELDVLQSYESESYSDVVVKTLELVREPGGWKIRRETAAPSR